MTSKFWAPVERKESRKKVSKGTKWMLCLSRLMKQRHSQANWEYIQTLSVCVGGIVRDVWGATYLLRNEEQVRERHEWIVKRRFLSVNSTHSFPWRAASSPPWPCPAYCLPRSFCGTSDSRTCEPCTSDSSMHVNATRSSFRSIAHPELRKGFRRGFIIWGNTDHKLVLL